MEGLNIAIADDVDPDVVCSKIDSRPLGIEVKDLERAQFVDILVDCLFSGSQAFVKQTMEKYDFPEEAILNSVIQRIVRTRISACRAYIEEFRGSREEVDGELVEESFEFIVYLERTFRISSN